MACPLLWLIAARGWSQYNLSFGSFEVFEEAGRLGGEMIRALMESEEGREGGGCSSSAESRYVMH